MSKTFVVTSLVCCLALAAASWAQSAQTPPAQNLKIQKFCPPLIQLGNVEPIACFVDNNHLIGFGNPTKFAIPKGTQVSFVAKLVNAGPYCATVVLREPIPPHLFVFITGQPLFDNQAPCQAWRNVPPVNHP